MLVEERAALVAELALADQPAQSALALARFVYPDLDEPGCLAQLDAMSSEVVGSTHLSLRRVISISHGYGGDAVTYHDPDNSFLNRVLKTRLGIPITLSIIWIEVGRRCGIEVEGVGLPGHFLVYAGGQLCDPFHGGEAIGGDEAAALVALNLGGPKRLDPSWLAPVDTKSLIARVVRNLEAIYTERADLENLDWVLACKTGLV